MTEKTQVRAIGYARVSTEEQASSGLSLVHQRIRIAAFAKASDFDLVEVIEEQGRSAKDLKRPGLLRALELLEGGGANALVVLSLDRLTRSVKDLGHLVEFFDRTKTALVAVQDSINTLTAGGRLVLNVLGSIAQWEREAIGERTSAALAIKRQRGEKTGGTVPYGYDADSEGRLAQNLKEQEAIRFMVVCWRKGLSLRKIATLLKARGYVPKMTATWHPQVIKQLLALHFPGRGPSKGSKLQKKTTTTALKLQ